MGSRGKKGGRSLRFDVYEKGYNGQKALIPRVRARVRASSEETNGAPMAIFI